MRARKKVDIRQERYLLFVDTETIGSIDNPESIFPFDVSYKVYDTETEQTVKEECLLIKKFFNNKFVMLSSFSASKYPYYKQKLETDSRYSLVSPKVASEKLQKTIKKYGIKIITAQNGQFDIQALERLFNEFGVQNPISKLDLLDTMEISKIITFSNDYKNFCIRHRELLNQNKQSRFITPSNRVRTTAESIYSYLTNNAQFEESHTGLEDIDIEIYIYQVAYNMLGNKLVWLNTRPQWNDYSTI